MLDLGAAQLDSNLLRLDIDLLDGDRRNQHRLAADPVAGIDHQIPDVPPCIHEEIVDVADLTVCRLQVKTLQVTRLMQHMQPSR